MKSGFLKDVGCVVGFLLLIILNGCGSPDNQTDDEKLPDVTAEGQPDDATPPDDSDPVAGSPEAGETAEPAAPEPSIDQPSPDDAPAVPPAVPDTDQSTEAADPAEPGSAAGGDNSSLQFSESTSSNGPRSGKGEVDPDFDPIKEHGPIFVGWPKPRLAIVFTGRVDGYIEPCGCAGLEKMKGGMNRRHALFRNLRRKRGWPTVGIDVGGIAKGYGKQAELKFQAMVESMRTMDYDAIALGGSDLRLPTGELVAVAADTGDHNSPFLSANVALFDFAAGLTNTVQFVEESGIKLGVTGILGNSYRQEINNPELQMIDAEKAIEKVLPKLVENSNLQILLAHASMDQSVALAKRFPEFDIVVTAGGAPEPPAKPETVEGTETLLIEVGEKGMTATVLALYDDPQRPWRYQRVPLDSRFPHSEPMHALLVAYQKQLEDLGWEGLGLRPVPDPKQKVNGKFVGTKECRNCHEPSYDVWKKSGHAKAWETLEELQPSRIHDPECVSCHVVGWHPTKYFPYENGFWTEKTTPHLVDVGCESCHGPGEKHVWAETYGDEAERERYRQAVVITKEDSREWQCVTCHDLDNSPEFDFDTYWPEVEHYE